jgi:molecular chaperone HscB
MDPFAILGLPRRYTLDAEQLEQRYRRLQKALHPDRHAGQAASARRMSLSKAVEVNEAYRTLKDELKRAEALLALHGLAGGEQSQPQDPELLLEVMELREALGEAKAEHDLAQVRALAERVAQQRGQARAALEQAFEELPERPAEQQLQGLALLLGRLKYFQRFLDEVDVIEEQALA